MGERLDDDAADTGEVDVSVIIPAHNAADTISAQLGALSAGSIRRATEIIVVANRCSDGTVDRVTQWQQQTPRLHLVIADDRAGASYARNLGAAHAAGRLFLFCDADDVVGEDWVDAMCDALDHSDLVGGRLEPMPDTDPKILRLFPTYRTQQRYRLVAKQTVLYAMTASMGCRRTTFASFGGFDDRMTYGCDDVVASLRAQQAGFRVGFAHEALCNYRIRGDLAQVTRQRQAFARSNVMYERLYYPAASRPISFEIAHLLVIGLRTVVAAPTQSRHKWMVHARVQLARVRAAASPLEPAVFHPDWSARPGFLATAGRVYPKLRCIPSVRRAMQAWALVQPLVDYTVPLSTPTVGGLGLIAPYFMARNRPNHTEVDALIGWTLGALGPGGRSIHIGAHAGELSTAAAMTVGAAGSVVVVEPLAQLARACRENAARHARDTPFVVSLTVAGRRNESQARFVTVVDDDGVIQIAYRHHKDAGHIDVPMQRLDAIADGSYDVLTIATHGTECAVLTGASALLQENPAMKILVMVDPDGLEAAEGSSVADLVELLANRGTLLELSTESGKPTKVDLDELIAWSKLRSEKRRPLRRWLTVESDPDR